MSLDSQIYQCNNNVQKYKVLKRKLENVVSYLCSSRDDCTDLKGVISNLYQIDNGESNVENRILNLKKNIDSTCNTINNTVIPAIDSAINSLNSKRKNLETEKKKEEARKKDD